MFKKKPEYKRKFVRLNLHCLLKYEKLQGQQVLSFVRNISAGGVLFHSQEELPVGATMRLKLNFLNHPEPISVIAKVLRVNPLKKLGGFDIAVEFINIEEKDRDFINKQLLEIADVKAEDSKDRKY